MQNIRFILNSAMSIFYIVLLFASLPLQALSTDVETSLVTYRENFKKIFICSDNILCLDRFQYRKDMKDFVLIVEQKV
ncbi:hypothetical protein L4D77_19515 [Photobacterium frigidiphilum]|uniref:hypothetical protein n=1 Tax=Photobacterium frigidiphilum TaxID=264736 RepID=UPI003D151F56